MELWLEAADGARMQISTDVKKHSSYINGLLDGIGNTQPSADIMLPFADHTLLDNIVAFLKYHQEDAIVEENWQQFPPRPLDQWDREHLDALSGVQLTLLMKCYNFLGHQLGLNVVGTMIGHQIQARDERGLSEFFGHSMPLLYSKEQLAVLKTQIPEAFR